MRIISVNVTAVATSAPASSVKDNYAAFPVSINELEAEFEYRYRKWESMEKSVNIKSL